MFLNERVLYEADAAEVPVEMDAVDSAEAGGSTVTGDVDTFVEAMYFAEKAWNRLSMKMVRAEHTAIINEDAMLMENAVSDFGKKVVAWAKDMWNRIQAFVSQLITRITTTVLNNKRVQAAITGAAPKGTFKVSAKHAHDIDNWNLDTVSSERKTASKGEGTANAGPTEYKKAVDIIKGARGHLTEIQKTRNEAKTALNEVIKAANAKTEEGKANIQTRKAALTDANAKIVRQGRNLNRGLFAAIGIVFAASRSKAPEGGGAAAAAPAASGNQQASASILDQFDW